MALRKKVADYTFNDAKTRITDAVAAVPLGKDGYRITFEMIEKHNFWSPGGLDGDGWGGQRSQEPQVNLRILSAVKPMFTPDDVVGELVANVDSGLLQREAFVGFSPVKEPPKDEAASATEAREKRVRDVLAAISRWWDKKEYWKVIGSATRRATWSGRGPARFRINPANLVNGQLKTGQSIDDALDCVEIDAPLPDFAGVFVDPDTERKVGITIDKFADEKETAQIWTVEGTGDTRKTKCRVLDPPAPGAIPNPPVEHELELGGRIPVFEIQMQPLISEPMRQQQVQLNFIRTVLSRTIEAAGFKARFMGNVEPPLIWLEDPPRLEPVVKVDTSSGRPLYGVAQPWIFGAGMTTEMMGLERTNADGSKDRHEPTITIDEPTDTAFVTNPAEKVRSWIYKAGKQGHLGGSSTVELSGDAYEQARAQHEADLIDRASPVEGVTRDSIECLIALGALMSDDLKGFLEDFRCVVHLHIQAGPLRPDQARVNFEAYAAGVIALPTVQSRFGVEDTDAEARLLDQDDRIQLDLWSKRFSLLAQGSLAGVEQLVACFFAGLTEDQAEMVVTGLVPAWAALSTKVTEMRRQEAELARRQNPRDPNAPAADPNAPQDPNAPPTDNPSNNPPADRPGNRPPPPPPRPEPKPQPAAA